MHGRLVDYDHDEKHCLQFTGSCPVLGVHMPFVSPRTTESRIREFLI
jgi:hypothetical protein